MEAGAYSLPVRVVENPRATRLTLRIVPGGQALRLTTPPHVSDAFSGAEHLGIDSSSGR